MASQPSFFDWLRFAAVLIRMLQELFDGKEEDDKKKS